MQPSMSRAESSPQWPLPKLQCGITLWAEDKSLILEAEVTNCRGKDRARIKMEGG